MKIEHLNATFQPAKIGHPHGLQVTYLKDNSTRNIFIYHEDGKVLAGRVRGELFSPLVVLGLFRAFSGHLWSLSNSPEYAASLECPGLSCLAPQRGEGKHEGGALALPILGSHFGCTCDQKRPSGQSTGRV